MPQVAADIQHLKKITQEIRIDIIRMLTEAGSGHPGGSHSCLYDACCLEADGSATPPLLPQDAPPSR